MVATTARQDAHLDRAVETARAAGRPEHAVPLSAAEVAERCRSPLFRRGVLFPDCSTVHPGPARARAAAGGARGGRLGVRGNARHGGRARRAADGGRHGARGGDRRRDQRRDDRLAARAGPADGVRQLHRAHRAGARAAAEIGWTGGEAIVDARMFLHYFRTTNDGRVLMGSGSGPIGRGNRIDRRFTHDAATAGRAELGLRRLLPGLAAARVERAWGGPIDVSADHLPFVGTAPGGRIHYAAGYSGNGVGPSWLAGQALASLVTRTRRRVRPPAARQPHRRARPAGAGSLPRRRGDPRGDPRLRGGRGGRPPPTAPRARRRLTPTPARHGPRHSLDLQPRLPSRHTRSQPTYNQPWASRLESTAAPGTGVRQPTVPAQADAPPSVRTEYAGRTAGARHPQLPAPLRVRNPVPGTRSSKFATRCLAPAVELRRAASGLRRRAASRSRPACRGTARPGRLPGRGRPRPSTRRRRAARAPRSG